MTVPTALSVPVPPSEAPATARLGAAAVDASCRLPVLFLFAHAAAWLALGIIFSVISAIKVHAPGFLASSAWLTYGRVRPASLDMLVYGFVLQASLGVALWMICRLGRSLMTGPWIVCAAAVIWNLGVLIGTVQVFYGGSTSFAWLEFPRTATPILFCAYLIIGGVALVNLHLRTEQRMYVSQWFIFAALLWFPWIYSTAQLLLLVSPVRGVMQVIVTGWFGHNLFEICLGGFGLAIIFYLMPKLIARPLHTHGMALFGFWLLVIIGGWGGLRLGEPVPNWLAGVSGVGRVLLVVPLIALGSAWFGTLRRGPGTMKADLVGRFIFVAAVSYFLAEALHIIAATPAVNRITLFTTFQDGIAQLRIHGFLSMALLGSMYYAAPRLAGVSWPSANLVRMQYWMSVLGVLLLVVPLLAGGLVQGLAINDPKVPFIDIVRRLMPFVGTSTLGMTLLCLGYLTFVLHLGRLLAAVCPCGAVAPLNWVRPAVPAAATGGVKG